MTFENSILRFAAVLVAGVLGGELATRFRLPRVTGWISAGIALRLIGLPGLASGDFREVFGPFVDFVLGYIAFSVGSALHIARFKNAGKRLALLIASEATITPALVAGGLMLVGDQPAGVSWILGAVAIAAAPGTTMVVVKEARARGVFVKTLIAAVALIDMTAVCLITHAVILGDGPVRGVLGLSSNGLEFAAPDERRVHAVLLLVIPATEEAHYLEIVAAFSAGIVSNPTMRYQLYQSPSTAHTHKILNPRGDIDFNCFLDENLIASSPPPTPQRNGTTSL